MDKVHKDFKEALDPVDSPKGEDLSDGEEDSELNSLLPPKKGGMAKNPDQIRRKVQWNDNNGNKLAEVVEFEPSDVSDSEDEDSDVCLCSIM